jgi:hypothetical protein
MTTQLNPVPGDYYINLSGQLIKVKYVLYSQSVISRVMLEYQGSHCFNVRLDEWQWLDLKPYSEWFFDDDAINSVSE